MIRGVFILFACVLVHGSAFADMDHNNLNLGARAAALLPDGGGYVPPGIAESITRPMALNVPPKKKLSRAANKFFKLFRDIEDLPKFEIERIAFGAAEQMDDSTPREDVLKAFSSAMIAAADTDLRNANDGKTLEFLHNAFFNYKHGFKKPVVDGSFAADLLNGVARDVSAASTGL